MSRIRHAFTSGPVFVGYLTAGHQGIERTVDAALALVKGGVDLLEIGLPFTDPIADGPVIQAAMNDALDRGTTPQDVLSAIERIRRQSSVPIVLFSYANPLIAAGDAFLSQAKQAGCDGILTIDASLDDQLGLFARSAEAQLDTVVVASPSTPAERVDQLNQRGSGFLYYACRKGITGMRDGLPSDLKEKISQLKIASSLPVVVGFGIADRQSARTVLDQADGFVVGSAFVEAIASGTSDSQLSALAETLDPREKHER